MRRWRDLFSPVLLSAATVSLLTLSERNKLVLLHFKDTAKTCKKTRLMYSVLQKIKAREEALLVDQDTIEAICDLGERSRHETKQIQNCNLSHLHLYSPTTMMMNLGHFGKFPQNPRLGRLRHRLP